MTAVRLAYLTPKSLCFPPKLVTLIATGQICGRLGEGPPSWHLGKTWVNFNHGLGSFSLELLLEKHQSTVCRLCIFKETF